MDRPLSSTDISAGWGFLITLGSIFPEYTMLVMISGIAGGTVRWGKDQLTVRQGLIAVTQGGVMAVFLWPLAAPLVGQIGFQLSLTPTQEFMTGGFLIGLLCDFILSLIWKRTAAMEAKHADTD